MFFKITMYIKFTPVNAHIHDFYGVRKDSTIISTIFLQMGGSVKRDPYHLFEMCNERLACHH